MRKFKNWKSSVKSSNNARSKALRLETLEDRQMLSVTDLAAFSVVDNAAPAEICVSVTSDQAIDLSALEASEADANAETTKLAAPVLTQNYLRTGTNYMAVEWEPIENAVKYEVKIDQGNGNFIEGDTTETLYLMQGWPGAVYKAQIRAIAGDSAYLDSDWSEVLEVHTKTKLATSQPRVESVTIDGAVVAWNSVEGAGSYKYSYTFTDADGVKQTVSGATTETSVAIPSVDADGVTIPVKTTIDFNVYAYVPYDDPNYLPGTKGSLSFRLETPIETPVINVYSKTPDTVGFAFYAENAAEYYVEYTINGVAAEDSGFTTTETHFYTNYTKGDVIVVKVKGIPAADSIYGESEVGEFTVTMNTVQADPPKLSIDWATSYEYGTYIVWDESAYRGYSSSEVRYVIDGQEYTSTDRMYGAWVSPSYDLLDKTFTVQVRLRASRSDYEGVHYLDTDWSEPIEGHFKKHVDRTVPRLESIDNDGVTMAWDGVENADYYGYSYTYTDADGKEITYKGTTTDTSVTLPVENFASAQVGSNVRFYITPTVEPSDPDWLTAGWEYLDFTYQEAIAIPEPERVVEKTTNKVVWVSWPAVENAVAYEYEMVFENGETVSGTTTETSISFAESGNIKLRAISADGSDYLSSDFSESINVETKRVPIHFPKYGEITYEGVQITWPSYPGTPEPTYIHWAVADSRGWAEERGVAPVPESGNEFYIPQSCEGYEPLQAGDKLYVRFETIVDPSDPEYCSGVMNWVTSIIYKAPLDEPVVTFRDQTLDSVTLGWEPVENAVEYSVQCFLNGVEYANFVTTDTEFTCFGKSGDVVELRVQAIPSADVNYVASPISETTTNMNWFKSDTPTDLIWDVDSTKDTYAVVKWNHSWVGIDHFEIKVIYDNGEEKIFTSDRKIAWITGEAGQSFTYQVRAIGMSGEVDGIHYVDSDWSEVGTASMKHKLAMPEPSVSEYKTDSMVVSWEPVANATSYAITYTFVDENGEKCVLNDLTLKFLITFVRVRCV